MWVYICKCERSCAQEWDKGFYRRGCVYVCVCCITTIRWSLTQWNIGWSCICIICLWSWWMKCWCWFFVAWHSLEKVDCVYCSKGFNILIQSSWCESGQYILVYMYIVERISVTDGRPKPSRVQSTIMWTLYMFRHYDDQNNVRDDPTLFNVYQD